MQRILLTGALFLPFCAHASFASELVYTPINPSFGGNAFNSSHLLATAQAQNQFKAPSSGQTVGLSDSDRFVQQLQAQLYAGLAQKVSDAIFGQNAQNHGTFQFGDQKISFLNDGTQVTLTIINTTTGQTTSISVPSGTTSGP
ncbi:MAG: curli assembly protein CsgF [Proteobacteria bacterium]|nr:curli assembly protein CsgF [Pseudomonadota bacterium]